MKVCAQCGSENNDAAKFCKSCGNNMAVAKAPAQPAAPAQQPPMQRPAQPMYAQPVQQPRPMQQPMQAPYGQPMPAQQQQYAARPGQPVQQGAARYAQQLASQINSEQMMNFFRWLVTAIKNPSQKYRVSNLYAALVAVISGLLFGLQGYLSSMTIVNAMYAPTKDLANIANSMSSSFGGPSIPTVPGVPFTVFLYKFVIGVLTVYAVYGVALLGMKMFGDEISPAQLHVLFAQKLVPLLGLQIVATVLAFIPPSKTAIVGLLGGQVSSLMADSMSGNPQSMTLNFDSVDASLFVHNPSLVLQVPSVALQALYLVLLILVPVSFLATARYKGKLDREWMWVIFILVGVIAMFIVSAIDKSFMTSAWSNFWMAVKNIGHAPSLPRPVF
ncbi:hypothetical protein [Gardnerella sp. 2492-Sm]|uniref:hypothetical protein n=1 Tax=unclassified Gardnerella TaxID=2628112 RepID=UPI003D08C4AE